MDASTGTAALRGTDVGRRAAGLADRLDPLGLPDAALRLKRVVSSGDGPTLHTLVVGRFSVGKSTLINAFLGYPVLPGGLAPTTGTLCKLSYGDPGAAVRFNDGRTESFTGPEALRPYLELNQPGLEASARLASIVRVEVSLPLPLLAGGIDIMDSPGLDEESSRSRMVEESLDRADLILFVLAADQLLGEIERRFLADEILPRSRGGLAIVVNFWDRIPPRSRPDLLDRLHNGLDEALETTGAPAPAIFTVSARNAVLARWKGRSEAGDSGVLDLEEWLKSAASDRDDNQARALSGRLRHALRLAVRDCEQRQQPVRSASVAARESVDRAKAALFLAGDSLERAMSSIDSGLESLTRTISLRTAAGEGALRVELQNCLRKNPYTSPAVLNARLGGWWAGLQKDVRAEADVMATAIAGTLAEGRVHLPAGGLPVLGLNVPPPKLDAPAPADSGAPVRDTISGLLDTVSRPAADRAASWMKKATQVVGGIDPVARRYAEAAIQHFEAAMAVAAYQAREQVDQWGSGLAEIVRQIIAERESALELELSRADRGLREARNRLTALDAVVKDLGDLDRGFE